MAQELLINQTVYLYYLNNKKKESMTLLRL